MKEQLTNEEIARVFALYYLQRCIVTKRNAVHILDGRDLDALVNGAYTNVKLLLTPLSEITDEHAVKMMQIEYSHILNGYETIKIERNEKGRIHIRFRWKHLDAHRNLDDGYSYSSWASNFSSISKEEFQYLVKNGYAVPLFFDLNHWANGKTAIELGVAVEKVSAPQF